MTTARHRRLLAIAALPSLLLAATAAQDAAPPATTRPAATTQPAGADAPAPVKAFDPSASDAKAIALADRCIAAAGGTKAWDEVRYLVFDFFSGARSWVWDRVENRVRVESVNQVNGLRVTTILDLDTGEGRAWRNGSLVLDAKYHDLQMDIARGGIVNDGYWMLMPLKLKDPGVRLRHLGPMKAPGTETPCEAIELTFDEGIGLTAHNKYVVYLDDATGLPAHWDFYVRADDESPRLSNPWRNWVRRGGLLFSLDRGEARWQIPFIEIYDEVPESVFADARPYDRDAWTPVEAKGPAPAGAKSP